jgi:hypothetical protein
MDALTALDVATMVRAIGALTGVAPDANANANANQRAEWWSASPWWGAAQGWDAGRWGGRHLVGQQQLVEPRLG